MMSSTVELQDELAGLRAVVADEDKPLAERTAAAAHIVTLALGAVTDPADDDAEVAELVKPWADPVLAKMAAEVTGGRSVNGHSLPDAKQTVFKRRRWRAVLTIICDETAHKLTRLAACQTALDSFLHPNGAHRKAGYSAERLLAEVKPADGFKWTSKGKLPVCRPPVQQSDLWDK
jgi:hypothetical protein